MGGDLRPQQLGGLAPLCTELRDVLKSCTGYDPVWTGTLRTTHNPAKKEEEAGDAHTPSRTAVS